MQPLRAHHMAHEAEEYPAMNESTTDIRIVPLPNGQDVLTEILRDGARRLLAEAIEAEVAAWIDAHAHLKDASGRHQVVRNGHLPGRTIPGSARSRSSSPGYVTAGPPGSGRRSRPPSCPRTCGGPRAWRS